MTHVVLYWSHICVLHRQEKQFLEKLTQKLYTKGIELEVHYFGLGYPQHMSEYLAHADAVLPDIIVSADLEVFEDPRIYQKIENSLYPVSDWVPLREVPSLKNVQRDEKLLPVAAIPLVYYTRNPETCQNRPLPDVESLAFGGINNSAVKTVAKYVWEQYGKDAAESLLERCLVTDMPIGAYQAVRLGQTDTALCPSLYALRADEKESFLRIPKEGPLLIPSYFCAGNSISEEIAKMVANEILCRELCDFYVENGDLILYPVCTTKHSRQENDVFACPSKDWLKALDPAEFYDFYKKKLPTAQIPDFG